MSDFSTLLHKRLQIATEAKPSLYISGVLHYLSMTSHRSLVNFCMFRADFNTYAMASLHGITAQQYKCTHVDAHVGTLYGDLVTFIKGLHFSTFGHYSCPSAASNAVPIYIHVHGSTRHYSTARQDG